MSKNGRAAFLVWSFASVLLIRPALAYGPVGHQTVGAIAEQRMSQTTGGRAALKRARALLGGDSLARASIWADQIKSGTGRLAGAARRDGQQFLEGQFKGSAIAEIHHDFHFTDLPFQRQKYTAGAIGTTAIDVVQMTAECISVLQGKSTSLSPPIALRLLIHYVGDMHQPLHVGSGWIRRSGGSFEFVDPDDADPQGAQNDIGGNNLVFADGSRIVKLHSFWDTPAVTAVMAHRISSGDPTAFASDLIRRKVGLSGAALSGDVSTWAQKIADDALPISKQAYDGISVVSLTGKRFKGSPIWNVELPDGYKDRARDLTETQLGKAGFRLAELLTRILKA